MPYIKEEDRVRIEDWVADCGGDGCNLVEALAGRITCAGDLNYVITRIIQTHLEYSGMCYANLNEIVGALECCKLEFIRRVVSPYEDEKIKINGDVHPQNL